MRRTVLVRRFGSFLMMAALAWGGFRVGRDEEKAPTPPTPPPAAAPVTMAETVTDGLSKILMGGAPNSVADLKAMQERVQKLTDKLMLATVGVQVGQAQGSGVIVTKDGYVLTAAHCLSTVDALGNVTITKDDGTSLVRKVIAEDDSIRGLQRTDILFSNMLRVVSLFSL